MTEHVYKVVELVGTSEESVTKAIDPLTGVATDVADRGKPVNIAWDRRPGRARPLIGLPAAAAEGASLRRPNMGASGSALLPADPVSTSRALGSLPSPAPKRSASAATPPGTSPPAGAAATGAAGASASGPGSKLRAAAAAALRCVRGDGLAPARYIRPPAPLQAKRRHAAVQGGPSAIQALRARVSHTAPARVGEGGWKGTQALDGGGAMMNQAIHNVDLLYWLMGDVAEVSAVTATLGHQRIEVEDIGVRLIDSLADLAGVTFVAHDLAAGSLDNALAAAGHSASAPTLFIAEGLLRYLPEPTIHDLFALTAARSAPGSVFALTFSTREAEVVVSQEERDHEAMLAELGEHVLTLPSRATALGWLAGAGWDAEVVDDVATEHSQPGDGRLLIRATPADGLGGTAGVTVIDS